MFTLYKFKFFTNHCLFSTLSIFIQDIRDIHDIRNIRGFKNVLSFTYPVVNTAITEFAGQLNRLLRYNAP